MRSLWLQKLSKKNTNMAKKLKYLVIHCSDTPAGRNVKAATIVKWHTDPAPRGRGWKVPGYSNIWELDGTMANIRQYNDDGWVQSGEITNGALGYNDVSRHVCYVGGWKGQDTRTVAQKEAMKRYVLNFLRKHPGCEVVGHRDLQKGKACPSFDVKAWVKEILKEERVRKLGNIGNLDPKSEKRV